MVTKETIETLLMREDNVGMHAVGRCLVALYNRQTADEKVAEDVKHNNGMGFVPCDAKMGSSMAQFYTRNKYLSPKQIAYWRKENDKGKARILKYAGQMLVVVKEKEN